MKLLMTTSFDVSKAASDMTRCHFHHIVGVPGVGTSPQSRKRTVFGVQATMRCVAWKIMVWRARRAKAMTVGQLRRCRRFHWCGWWRIVCDRREEGSICRLACEICLSMSLHPTKTNSCFLCSTHHHYKRIIHVLSIAPALLGPNKFELVHLILWELYTISNRQCGENVTTRIMGRLSPRGDEGGA